MSGCRRIVPYLDALVDGELSAEQTVEADAHLAECAVCAERVRWQRLLRADVRAVVREAARPSESFRARVASALRAERERESARAEPEPIRMLSWRAIVPLAAAAAVALFWAASTNSPDTPGPGSRGAEPERASVMDVLDDFVDNHVSPPRPEVVDPSGLERFEPKVGVPVRAPSFVEYGGRWEGGSVVWVNASQVRAVSLRYSVAGHRVTVYVYDAARIPLRTRLEPRVVRDVPVYVGTRRGYSIAAAERRGVGYAVATDLDDQESAELAVTSLR